MSRKNQNELILGDWNTICDVCGWKFKASDLRKRWDGLMVCSQDWEPRHPQDFIRAIPDMQRVPWVRPESTDKFISNDFDPSMGNYPVPPGTFNPYDTPSPVISAPNDGDTVSGNVTITFTSSHLENVVSGLVAVDGIGIFAATNGSTTWDSSSVPDGNHDISFTVVDSKGDSHSFTITVDVENGGGGSNGLSFYTVII